VNRRTWVTVVGALTVLIGAVAVGGGGTSRPATGSGDDMPGALSAHLDKLSQALPSNGGEGNRGPGGADAAFLQALAFPGTDIPLVFPHLALLFGFTFMALAAMVRIRSYISGKFE